MGFYRTLRVATHAEHLEIERLYVCSQVYNAVLDVWYKLVTPLGMFSGGVTIVVACFLTLRHTDVPWYIYFWFPYVAFLFAVTIFDTAYDGIVVIRASEATLTTLRSREMQYLRRMPTEERAAVIRRAKALRPVCFSIGSFTEFNMDVPVASWDEILNQLLFLLTF